MMTQSLWGEIEEDKRADFSAMLSKDHTRRLSDAIAAYQNYTGHDGRKSSISNLGAAISRVRKQMYKALGITESAVIETIRDGVSREDYIRGVRLASSLDQMADTIANLLRYEVLVGLRTRTEINQRIRETIEASVRMFEEVETD